MISLFITPHALAAAPVLRESQNQILEYMKSLPFVHSATISLKQEGAFRFYELTASHKHAGTEAYVTLRVPKDIADLGVLSNILSSELDVANDALMHIRSKPEGPNE